MMKPLCMAVAWGQTLKPSVISLKTSMFTINMKEMNLRKHQVLSNINNINCKMLT